jgi:anti-anti-sigma factor
MHIEARTSNGFHVLRVAENLSLSSDPGELLTAVEGALSQGMRRIALEFTPASMLYSRTIAILVQCVEHVNEAGGRFVILRPSQHVMTSLRITCLDRLVTVCPTEEELGKI